MEKWSIDQGNLMSVIARKHRLGLYLRSKGRQLLRKKSADSFKDSVCSISWNFVKVIKEVSLKWKS